MTITILFKKRFFLLYLALLLVTTNILWVVDKYFFLNHNLLFGAVLCFSIQLIFLSIRKFVHEKNTKNSAYWGIYLSYLTPLVDLLVILILLVFFKNPVASISFLLAFHLNIIFIVSIVFIFRKQENND
jgi:hypothetical protein